MKIYLIFGKTDFKNGVNKSSLKTFAFKMFTSNVIYVYKQIKKENKKHFLNLKKKSQSVW